MKIFRVYVRREGEVRAVYVGNVEARNGANAIRQVAGWNLFRREAIKAIRVEEAK